MEGPALSAGMTQGASWISRREEARPQHLSFPPILVDANVRQMPGSLSSRGHVLSSFGDEVVSKGAPFGLRKRVESDKEDWASGWYQDA